MNLETAAYWSVVKAFVAGNNLNFDTEALLTDLQKALNIDDDTCTDLLCKADEDQEACVLKQYDKSILPAHGAPPQQARPAVSRPAPTAAAQPTMAAPTIATTPSGYAADPNYGQPIKKPKKAASIATAPASAPRPSRPAPSTKSRPPRSAPSTPAGGLAGPNMGSRSQPKAKLPIGQEALARAMHRGQAGMQSYLQDLNAREREIFSELINMGVDENNPELKDIHKMLLQWYKLDAREVQIEQEIVMGA